MKRKSYRKFITEHRDEIDSAIRRALNQPDRKLNDAERYEWIINDEGLYNWAREEGVKL